LTHRYCNNARARNETPQIFGRTPYTPIVTRTRKHKSRTIIIEDEEIFCNNSIAVLINTANWLIKKGKITPSECPIKIEGSSYLINTRPYHEDGRDFRTKKELQNNLFLEGNWSSDNCINKSKELLIRFGIPATNFDLEE
ncbi:MAG TPA: hypothetical protein DCW42_06210, partial [Bacteroidetes bacterium]|nr:hypothetical protein [Bacteroidota bacterium]